MEDITITKREILVSVIIVLVLITIGLFISNAIENNINENNEKYYKSLKITDDNGKFKYAIDTNIGYVLAKGKVKAVDGVSIEDIKGTYFKIKKEREEYTRHTREVTKTKVVNGNTVTYTETEVYYTWDYAGEEVFHSNYFEFLGIKFKYDTINFYNQKYKETIKESYDVRYVYYVIPVEFEGCLFTNIKNSTINENEFYYNNSIEDIIEAKQKEHLSAKIAFWIIWWFIIIGAVIGFVCLENNYLEDKKEGEDEK